jgi:hypothetical protein
VRPTTLWRGREIKKISGLLFSILYLAGCGHEPLKPIATISVGDDEIHLQSNSDREEYYIAWNAEQTLITQVDIKSIGLKKFFSKIKPDQWLIGAEFLPADNFRITISRLPASADYLSQRLFKIFEQSFHVKIIQGDEELAGYQLKCASLPAAFKKVPERDGTIVTSTVGYRFEGVSLADLAKWVESQLQVPVEHSGADDHNFYAFEIPCDTFQPATAIDSLRAMGFTLEQVKLKRPAISISRSEAVR